MTDQGLRPFLEKLEASGSLHRVDRKVDLEYEISAVLGLRGKGPAQLFQNVRGHGMPVIGNLLNSRARFEEALDIAAGELDAHCIAALKSPVPPVIVSDAPVQEETVNLPFDIGKVLPVPYWFEHEAGPYITAGVIIAKHPDTGKRNVSIARLRLEGGSRMMAGIAKNHHLAIMAERARQLEQDLEIAVVLGNHPAVMLGSQLYLGLGDDEFDTVGAILGEPLRLVKCKTVDLEVPAEAEIVIEAVLKPGELIDEGAVSEFPGFYVRYGPGIAVEAKCITHRRDAIYQAILPGFAPEHCLLGGVAIGVTVCHALQKIIPSVRRVFVTEGGMGRLHAVISMHRPALGEAKRAIIAAMGQVNLFKLVIAVEDDIDPEDWTQVEWSLAARFRGHEDMIVLPGMKADRCDPVHENLTVTKIGMVATTRPGDGNSGTRSEFVRPRLDVLERVKRELDAY
ncbi:UbiD family decarboxylase [Neorhizobium sp. CSC1952]|uniref:UbiD family decarboxylase n=1 Tax=Neorhizobium sp. CSC1952 TaxID=2978974 RepID=UPI0025A645AD|nr:UbiD family decarboxylase [Rhizobium sp. CSC1952]WJR65031.1 UbiD family decarboxylase [Rhizobium sp. CSC1952]